MDAAPRLAPPPGRVAEASSLLLVALALLVAGAVFAGGGSRDDALATVGVAAVVCAAVALGVALRDGLTLPRLDRAGWLVVGASVALTGWTGLSIVWSIAGDLSWEWLDRGVVYLAFLALGWALLGVAVPSLAEEGGRIARLQEPVGFWNALALLADGAVGLGVWLLASRRLVLRLAGGLLVYSAVLVVLLTQSRAGVVAALAVVALSIAFARERLTATLGLGVAALPSLAVGGWAFTRPALVESGAAYGERVDDGRIFAVVALAGALLVALVLWWAPLERLVAERERAVQWGAGIACGLVVLGGSLGLLTAVGNPVDWGECVNDPGRLADLCANNRLEWWGDALEVARDRPLGGSGAGTFELARKRFRDDATPVGQPHSVPLQLLADLGVVGFALGLLVAVGAVLGVRRGLQLVGAPERPAAAGLACLVLAYAIHAVVDYDLDFLAVTAPAFVALGALLAVGRPPATARVGPAGLLAIGATAVAAVASIGLPALAERETDRAFEAADAGRVEEAVNAANRARRLDPLSPAPLYALAVAADAAGNKAAAVAWYEKATRLQPENPDVWFELGLYHSIATGDQCAAYQALNHSYTLDPMSRRWSPGGVLDVAREAVDAGACE
jgi:O-Antigen ligase/Tetratricopeptide repeat